MSPALRASYCRPVPGTPLDSTDPPIDPSTFPLELPIDLEAKTEMEKKWIKEALGNMSLLVIEPFEVDWCVSLPSFERAELMGGQVRSQWRSPQADLVEQGRRRLEGGERRSLRDGGRSCEYRTIGIQTSLYASTPSGGYTWSLKRIAREQESLPEWK